MTLNRPETIAAIAGQIRTSVSRRRLLQAAGIGGAAMVVAACGTGSEESGEAASATDISDTEMIANWSNWPLYLDVDEESASIKVELVRSCLDQLPASDYSVLCLQETKLASSAKNRACLRSVAGPQDIHASRLTFEEEG